MIRSVRCLLKFNPQSISNPLFRVSKKNHVNNRIIAERVFKLKEEEKYTKRNFRDTYLKSNLDVLLRLLSRDYKSLNYDQKFDLLKIILNKLELDTDLNIHKTEIDKNQEFKSLVNFFLDNLKKLNPQHQYLIGLFPFVMNKKKIFFIKYDFHLLSKLYTNYVETNHQSIEKDDLVLSLSLYGYFRPDISPEHFLEGRLQEFEFYGFYNLLTCMKRILIWDTNYLNKFKFHTYFTEIFTKLALKETYHNISISFNIISELDNKLIVDNYRKNLLEIYQELYNRIDEIDEQSIINIIRSIKSCKYIDFTEFLLKIDEIVLDYVSNTSIYNDKMVLINYLFKYLHYISFLDSRLLKKMKNFNLYFDMLKPEINEKQNINHLCSLNLIMHKTNIIDKDFISTEFDILRNKIYIKNPDESLISSLQLIQEVLGEERHKEIEFNANEYYKKKFYENQNIFKLLINFNKLSNVIKDTSIVDQYFKFLESQIVKLSNNYNMIFNLIYDYVDVYKKDLSRSYQEILEHRIVSLLSPNEITRAFKLKEEKMSELIIFLNELKTESNSKQIDSIIEQLFKNDIDILKYLTINLDKNVSKNYLDLLLFLQKFILDSNSFDKGSYILEDFMLILVYFLKHKSIDENVIKIIKENLYTFNLIANKFSVEDLNFSLSELTNINYILEKYQICDEFLVKLIENRVDNLTQQDNIYSELKEEILTKILVSYNISISSKEKISSFFLSNEDKIKLIEIINSSNLQMIREEYDVQRNVLSEKQSEEMKAIKKIVKTISQINENLFI